MPAKRAVARGAFQPADGAIYEIEIAEGEIVELTENDSPEGWQAVSINGIEGLVPMSFLEILPDEDDGLGEQLPANENSDGSEREEKSEPRAPCAARRGGCPRGGERPR